MQLAWIETFIAVADHGGFGAAAASLYLSQPRVSAHVAALEAELGAELFDRSQRPVTLTPAGQRMAAHAREILRSVERARADVPGPPQRLVGDVAIGTYPSAAAVFLPPVIARFRAEQPDVAITLVELPVVALEEALADGTTDLIIRPIAPHPTLSGTQSHILWRESMCAVFRPDHPLALNPAMTFADVLRHPLVIAGSRTGGEMWRFLSEQHSRPEIALTADQPATQVALVREGVGVGLMNALTAAATDTTGIIVRPLDETTLSREVRLFWRNRARFTPAAAALRRSIIDAPIPAEAYPVPSPDAG